MAEAEARVTTIEVGLAAAERDLGAARGALALGITAFVDRRIAAVNPNPDTGQPWLLPGDRVDDAEWATLMTALGPGVAVGLMDVLEHLQSGVDRAARGSHEFHHDR